MAITAITADATAAIPASADTIALVLGPQRPGDGAPAPAPFFVSPGADNAVAQVGQSEELRPVASERGHIGGRDLEVDTPVPNLASSHGVSDRTITLPLAEREQRL
jgi:hypothetical protein